MDAVPLNIAIEFSNITDTRAFVEALANQDKSTLEVSQLKANQALGASVPHFIVEFLAKLPTDLAISLLGSLIYDYLKGKWASEPKSKFIIKLGDVTVECQNQEDVVKLLAAAAKKNPPSEDTKSEAPK